MSALEELNDLSHSGERVANAPAGAGVVDGEFMQASPAVQQLEVDHGLVEKLLNSGLDGMATVVQMQATGRSVNMQPELQFELVLKVGNRQWTVNHIQVVSASLIAQLRSGSQIPVKVDPTDDSQLLIGLPSS